MPNSQVTYIRLPDAVRKAAEKLAEQEDRTLASLLRSLIRDGIVRRSANGKGK